MSKLTTAPHRQSQLEPIALYTLYGCITNNITYTALTTRLASLSQHPIIAYDTNHILTLEYSVSQQLPGRTVSNRHDVRISSKAHENFTTAQMTTLLNYKDVSCEVKELEECVLEKEDSGVWFLKALGATLKKEHVEVDVVEYHLANGVHVRIYQRARCAEPFRVDSVQRDDPNLHIVEVRCVAQKKYHNQACRAMKDVQAELSNIIELTKDPA